MPTPEASSPALDERLERGELVLFERCPFPLPSGDDLRFLLGWTVDGTAKSISFFPRTGVMSGQRLAPPAEESRLHALLAELSRQATAWLARTLPRYHAAMRFGPLRFRTEEEAGRVIDPRYDGRLLHVDANGDLPALGDSLLRIFVNLNREQSREWTTSVPLSVLLDRWRDDLREAGEGRPSLLTRLRLDYGRPLGLRPPAETPYDRLMMRAHFFGKTDEYLQRQAPRRRWVFPPGAAWLVFSDLVSHAVVGGAFAVDQTYLVARRAFRRPELSARSTMERFWAGSPAALPA